MKLRITTTGKIWRIEQWLDDSDEWIDAGLRFTSEAEAKAAMQESIELYVGEWKEVE